MEKKIEGPSELNRETSESLSLEFPEEGNEVIENDGPDENLNESNGDLQVSSVLPQSSPISWPRSFEKSMDLYSHGGRFSSSQRRSSQSHEASTRVSREISPVDIFANGTSYQRSDTSRSQTLKSALTPLLSETNLERLEAQSMQEEAVLAKKKAKKMAVQGEDDDSIVHLEVYDVRDTGASFMETCFNALNVLIGVGILSTPFAASQGGWLGLLLLLVFSIVFFNTALFLKDCIESRPYITTYPDIGEAAFGKSSRWIVAVLLYLELYSVTVDLMILEGDNLAQIFPHAKIVSDWLVLDPPQLMIIITAALVLPTVWMKDLSFLAYLSVCGVLASVLVVVGVTWVGVADGVIFSEEGRLFRLSGLPVAVGIYGFCFSGHTVLPNIYCSMKKPHKFSKVLAVSFGVSVLIYGGIAVVGYSMYGDNIQSQITLNIPPDSVISKIAIWTTVINPLTKFALMVNPLALSIEETFPWGPQEKTSRILSRVVRTLIIVSVVIVALSIPFFGLVMAFIGSFLGITMSVILPCACYLRLVDTGVTKSKVTLCVVYIVVGAVTAGVGTYSSIRNILAGLVDPDGSTFTLDKFSIATSK